VALSFLFLATHAPPADAAKDADDEPTIDVVVQEAPRPTSAGKDPTAAAYVVRGEGLARSGASMTDILQDVPGAEVLRRGGASDLATVSIRGATSAQTPIYLAGIRLNDEISGTVDLSTLPLWMLHRVEIYRGHAPPSADVLGMAGAIFLEPRLPKLRGRHGERPAFGEMGSRLGMGSFGRREIAARMSTGTAKAASLLSFRHRASKGNFRFLDDGGTRFIASDDRERERQNGDHQENDAWAVGRLTQGRATLTTLVNVFHRSGGTPGLQLAGAEHARYEQSRFLTGAAARLPCGDEEHGCVLTSATDLMLTRYGLHDPYRELGSTVRTRIGGHRVGQRLGVSWRPNGWLTAALGISQTVQGVELDRDGAPDQRAVRWRTRPEASAHVHPTDRLELSIVGSLACEGTEKDGGRAGASEYCDTLHPAARLGLRWHLHSTTSIFANAGRYVRVPALGELYGMSAVTQGNEQLEPERGLSTEIGLDTSHRGSWGSAFAQLVGFVRLADKLISYRRSSIGALKPYNVGEARVLGAEVALGADLWQVLSARLSATWLDPRDHTENRSYANDILPFRSSLTLAPSLSLRSPKWSRIALDRAQLTIRYPYRSSRVADPAGLITLDPQASLDVEALLSFYDRIMVRARLANILDQRGFDLVGYPLPGRAFFTSGEIWW
jgi:iron complex outermembrane receptor protein